MASKDKLKFKKTEEIDVPDKIVDQVIGQEDAINVIKKAAKQRRHVLLIGKPGTGKSMIGQALAELLPKEKLKDVLCLPNKKDENNPKVKIVQAGLGSKIIEKTKLKALTQLSGKNQWMFIVVIFAIIFAASIILDWIVGRQASEIMQAATRISGTMIIITLFIGVLVFYSLYKIQSQRRQIIGPKLIVDNSKKESPFIDATGLHEGALLGDVQHDPFQTGGLGTPAHERVSAGALHKASGGVLFIDEIATLNPEMQISILTAMQEKKMAITGRSKRSAGAMVKTDPVPTDFVLVAAGNIETMQKMHPALRSRIRGNGYEIYMKDKIKDNPENVERFARFVAQEIKKDKKIPHFTKTAVKEIIKEARRRAGRKGYLSLKLRDLGGLIRVSGDIAKEEGNDSVSAKHVQKARKSAATLEQQIAERYTFDKKEYQIIGTKGTQIGKVNGLAVIGGGEIGSGIVLPIEASVVPAFEKGRGKILATGKLGDIAKEAITNVSAIVKKYSGKSLGMFDIHIQFLQTYEGLEGDSASISVASAVVSALEEIPIKQNLAMTGSLSIRGEVLPIGGVNDKIEAAKEAEIKTIIIPKANEKDILIDTKGIKIIPAKNIAEVLEHALKWPKGKKKILTKIKKSIK